MKSKVFICDVDNIETKINNFLFLNKNIEIISVTQSQFDIVINVIIIYKENLKEKI